HELLGRLDRVPGRQAAATGEALHRFQDRLWLVAEDGVVVVDAQQRRPVAQAHARGVVAGNGADLVVDDVFPGMLAVHGAAPFGRAAATMRGAQTVSIILAGAQSTGSQSHGLTGVLAAPRSDAR